MKISGHGVCAVPPYRDRDTPGDLASPLRVPGFDEKILALYDKGMMTRDIQETVHERYGVEVSATLISEITAELGTEGGATVPEPSTLAAMLSMALAVLLVRAGRR